MKRSTALRIIAGFTLFGIVMFVLICGAAALALIKMLPDPAQVAVVCAAAVAICACYIYRTGKGLPETIRNICKERSKEKDNGKE